MKDLLRPRRVLLAALAGLVLAAPTPAAGQKSGSQEAAADSKANAQEQAEAGFGAATDPRAAELDELAAEVAAQLRCPVCRNQSVLESSAELSREMHDLIRERLAAGESPEQVKAYFVSRYGEWILLKPTARGINVLVYVLPLAALLLGALLVRERLRRWAGRTKPATDAPVTEESEGPSPASAGWTELDPEQQQWLEEAIRKG